MHVNKLEIFNLSQTSSTMPTKQALKLRSKIRFIHVVLIDAFILRLLFLFYFALLIFCRILVSYERARESKKIDFALYQIFPRDRITPPCNKKIWAANSCEGFIPRDKIIRKTFPPSKKKRNFLAQKAANRQYFPWP